MSDLLHQLHARGRLSDDPVLLADGAESWRARRLEAAVSQLAAWLRARQVRTLGLFADNAPRWVIADLAARRANVVRVPLPPFFTVAQLRHVLDRGGIDAVLGDDGLPVAALQLAWPEPAPTGLTLWRSDAPAVALPPGTGKITFTSGSTGEPRGVCLGDAQLDRVAEALAQALAGIDCRRHLCLLPLCTLLENIAGVELPLRLGAEVLLPSLAEVGLQGSSGLDLARLTSAIDRYQPSSLILLPQLLSALVDAAQRGWHPPTSLRFCAVGGARVAPALIVRARQLGLPVYEGYGLSECGSVVALNTPFADRPGSVGRPLAHVRPTIANGEIQVRGSGFLGYLGDPPVGIGTGDCAYVATGDLGHVDGDGFLHVDGRRKNLLISSFGRNISPEWVESELLQAGVIRQAVLFGDGRPWCVALLGADATTPDDTIASQVHCANQRLPDYAQVRRWLRLPSPLTAGDGLLTANGRPRREAIARRYQSAIAALYPSEPGDTPPPYAIATVPNPPSSQRERHELL